MPTIASPGGEVSWPTDEGTLGVVGVAPWSTLDFLSRFYALLEAEKDWHYPRVLIDINTKLPSRGRHFELGEADPSPAIAATISELHLQGATVVVVPCNTAHLVYHRWADNAPVFVPNIVTETISAARKAGATRVCAFGSNALAAHDLYGRTAEQSGLACRRLAPDEQAHVADAIAETKRSGSIRPETREAIAALARKLKHEGVDAILLGCTELSGLAAPISEAGSRAVDSNEVLARVAARALNLSPVTFAG